MICLFLDTSSELLKVSLLKDENVIYDKELITKNDHSSFLIPFINEAFKGNSIKFTNLDRIIVCVGPGSFTGTRISITAAKIYSYSLNIPIFPISSLEMMIYDNDGYDYYIPVIEDKNNYLYFSIFDKDKRRILEDQYLSFDEFKKITDNYDGKKLIISHDGIEYDGFECKKKKLNVVEISKNININNKEINPHLLKPNYIKKIDAESKL